MSRSVDLFIDAPASLGEVAAVAARAAGAAVSALRPEGGEPVERGGPVGGAGSGDAEALVVETADVRAVLRAHRFLDDGALALTRYRYALSVAVPDDGRPRDSPAAGLLRMVARELSGTAGWPVLLVIDLQYSEAVSGGRSGSGPRCDDDAAADDGDAATGEGAGDGADDDAAAGR